MPKPFALVESVKKPPADGYEPSAGNRQFNPSNRVRGRPTFGNERLQRLEKEPVPQCYSSVYRCLLDVSPDEHESDKRKWDSRQKVHAQTGPISRVYLRLHSPAPPAAGGNRPAGVFSGQPTFGSPNAGNPGAGRVHQAATEGRHSIELLVDPKYLPDLL